MINPHTSVGIAQVVFYALVLPIAIFVLVRNWKHGLRLASYPLVTFSLGKSLAFPSEANIVLTIGPFSSSCWRHLDHPASVQPY